MHSSDRDDARVARECGVDGIVVSSHGGRNLDGAVAPLRVLPGIVDAARRADFPPRHDRG
ncbi:MAG: alpha-hydroxy-acid oxidizing protein [Burkholderiales bacterium]|nr:alpha-hydroxy-acid oxidizing protein [Burkholderiales bacterium]